MAHCAQDLLAPTSCRNCDNGPCVGSNALQVGLGCQQIRLAGSSRFYVCENFIYMTANGRPDCMEHVNLLASENNVVPEPN